MKLLETGTHWRVLPCLGREESVNAAIVAANDLLFRALSPSGGCRGNGQEVSGDDFYGIYVGDGWGRVMRCFDKFLLDAKQKS